MRATRVSFVQGSCPLAPPCPVSTSRAALPCWLQVHWVSILEAQPKTKTSLKNPTVLERTTPACIPPIQAATLQHPSHLATCPGEPPLNPLDPPNARLYRSGKKQIYLAAWTCFCCQVLAATGCGVQASGPVLRSPAYRYFVLSVS